MARFGGILGCGTGSGTPPSEANRVAFKGAISPLQPGQLQTRRVFHCVEEDPSSASTGTPVTATCTLVQRPGG